ncbi:MAG: LamG domain-containing protein, partial [bacterium]|nr:LamG domain-containing protein [bacterium]
WIDIGPNSASGGGISGALPGTDIRGLTLAETAGGVAAVWSQIDAGTGVLNTNIRQIYMKLFVGNAWGGVNGSASFAGVSGEVVGELEGVISHNAQPTAAFFNDELFIAWQTFADQGSALAVVQYDGPELVPVFRGIHGLPDLPAQPQLAAGTDELNLVWLRTPFEAQDTSLYALKWNGSNAFVPELPGDVQPPGISVTGGAAHNLGLAADPTGRPTVVWQDDFGNGPEVYLRSDNLTVENVFIANAGTSVQSILNGNILGAGDVILVQGNLAGGFSVGAGDAGVAIIGAPGASVAGSVTIASGAADVVIQRLTIGGGVTVNEADRFTLLESTVGGGVILNGGADTRIAYNDIDGTDGLSLVGEVDSPFVAHNRITGGVNGIEVIGVGASIISYAGEVLDDAPAGYWRLGEPAGTTALDFSGNGNAGTYEGDVTRDAEDPLADDTDSAASVNAAGARVVVPDDPSLKPAQLTIEAWVRPESGVISTWDSVLMKSTISSWNDGYGLYHSGGNLIFWVNQYNAYNVSVPVATDTWTHIVATYDGSFLRIYKDGVEASSRAYSDPINHSNNDLLIGQGTGSPGYSWRGDLDEVAVYGTALSGTQVQAHYDAAQATGTVDEPGAVDVVIRHNQIDGGSQGLLLSALASGRIFANDIEAVGTGLSIRAAFDGNISDNRLHGAGTGLRYEAPAALSANEIFDNTTGVVSTVDGDVGGFGFVGATEPND